MLMCIYDDVCVERACAAPHTFSLWQVFRRCVPLRCMRGCSMTAARTYLCLALMDAFR